MNNKLLRVTQMNAVYFDKEIFNIFKQHLNNFFKFLPPEFVSKCDPEINMLLHICILHYSVLQHNCTFGQKMLSIKYSNMTYYKKMWYLVAHSFDYLRERLELSKPDSGFNYYFHKANMFVQMLRFCNISMFLQYGSKPHLIERFLGLEQVNSTDNAVRHYEDKYMTRELIWNGFIEILVYLLPLINYHKISRIVRNVNPLHKKPEVERHLKRVITSETVCAHCEEPPIVPCHMGCSHVFCYSCLRGNQVADSKYECPVCEYFGKRDICQRVHG